MFLLVSVILLTGVVYLSAMLGYDPPGADPPPEQTPPWEQTPPEADPSPEADTPRKQTPPRSRHPPGKQTPPPGSRLRHTVNERPVRILLECILVNNYFDSFSLLNTTATHCPYLVLMEMYTSMRRWNGHRKNRTVRL